MVYEEDSNLNNQKGNLKRKYKEQIKHSQRVSSGNEVNGCFTSSIHIQ